ncbi:hypothetical protein F7725_014572 [Dissostichus mawsoni]|uniref:Uncharacterized protein n=1 Tax=Dissostichus mawsoni TaxID=36200 RepID=A0A7J5YWA0_DISMA|nr:hypothetical protein F7725_014572 [Dissostichus mawsoni]
MRRENRSCGDGCCCCGEERRGEPLERCSHTAFIEDNTLYVWGGYKVVGGEDIVLPSDEIWLCDLYSGTWEMRDINGDKPPDLSGSCGSYLNGTLYIFAGCDPVGYTNQMFSVDLTEQSCTWKKVTDTKERRPHLETNTPAGFIETGQQPLETFYSGAGAGTMKSVFMNHIRPCGVRQRLGVLPLRPEAAMQVPLWETKETLELDMFCLDLDTWTWTQFDFSPSCSPLGRSMFTMTPTSDHTLFIYGGLGIDGNTLNDVWQLNTQKKEWKKNDAPTQGQAQVVPFVIVCHSACLGRDSDVVVFGGSSNMCLLMDSVAVLRAPSQNQCRDVFMFQTQPCSLFRLCEDLIAENSEVFEEQLTWLPSKLRNKIDKRVAFFSSTKPVLTA